MKSAIFSVIVYSRLLCAVVFETWNTNACLWVDSWSLTKDNSSANLTKDSACLMLKFIIYRFNWKKNEHWQPKSQILHFQCSSVYWQNTYFTLLFFERKLRFELIVVFQKLETGCPTTCIAVGILCILVFLQKRNHIEYEYKIDFHDEHLTPHFKLCLLQSSCNNKLRYLTHFSGKFKSYLERK